MMKKLSLLPGFLFSLIFLAGCMPTRQAQTPALPEQVELYYFYDNICASCVDEDEFYALFHEAAGDVSGQYPHRLLPFNVGKTGGRREFDELMARIGHSADGVSFPLLVAGSKVFQGSENIRKNIREAFLVAGEDIFVNAYVYNPADPPASPFLRYTADPGHHTAVYFYRLTCEECNRTKPVLDALPAEIAANGRAVPVDVISINTRSGDNGAAIRVFFERYNVPEEDQMVPIVFLREGYVAGYENIRAELQLRLEEGAGLGFEFP